MELREFVAESIKQIIDGICSSQEYAKDKGAVVNPTGMYYTSSDHNNISVLTPGASMKYSIPQKIDFDVLVTVSEGGEAKAGIGVFTGAISLGTQAKIEDENIAANRVKFSVPVLFPEQKLK